MKRLNLLFAILAAFVLTACSMPIPTLDIQAHFNPSAFGLETDASGNITVATHTVAFQARPGSIGGTVNGYRIEFFNRDQSPMIEGDNVLFATGSFATYVGPGLTCDEFIADNNHRCTINDTNVRYAPGVISEVSNFINIDGPIALYLRDNNEVGDFAMVYFNVITDNNFRQVIGPFEVALVIRVSN